MFGKNKKQNLNLEGQKELIQEEIAYQKGKMAVRDLISPSSMKITPRDIELGDKYVRTVFVMTYPRYLSVGWFAPIINLNTSLDIAMFFYPVSTEEILKKLRNKVGVIRADISEATVRDPMEEIALQDIEQLRDELTQGTEYFFRFALYVTYYTDSPEELTKLTETIETLFGSRLVFSKRVLYQAEEGFNSTLPLCKDELQHAFSMNSSACASSFPFISADLTSDNGILYGINRHNNSLILFDRFSLQNANLTVFATSGAGKSYAVKLEILRSLMMGTDVIVIDPENEYKHLCEAVGGSYINISLSAESKLNPFDLPKPVGEQVNTEDIIRSAVIVLKSLLKLMVGLPDNNGVLRFTPEEDSILDRALIETYAKRDITSQTDLTNPDLEMPVMADLDSVLSGMEGAQSLVQRLKKYTEGTFAGLLNERTNIETDTQMVVFSVRDLEDELKSIAIYTIMNYVWNVVRSNLKKRILTIDEAWWLMQQEDSAKFIFALVKRARKYFLGVTTITQDVNDFLTSTYGQAILSNSALQLLMKQSSSTIDLVTDTFKLTEGEKYLLLDSSVGEGIFFAGQKHAAIKIVASYTEDQLITTDPKQLLEIKEAKKDFDAQQQV
ncbi:MAG: DUF87 domain-containing protein [Patescibacteria group bacterium]